MVEITNVNLDNDLVMKAQEVLEDRGEDINMVLNDYLKKIIKKDYKSKKKKPEISMAELCGIFKGKIWTSDDFDEPLEDLKEYME